MSLLYGIFLIITVAAVLLFPFEILTIIFVVIGKVWHTVARWVDEA